MQYLNLTISAETKEQADKILDALLEKKLVTGGQIINAPAKFLWKDKITEMDYFTISTFTKDDKREEIINSVEEMSDEEVPMVTFTPFECNQKLADWIEETLK